MKELNISKSSYYIILSLFIFLSISFLIWLMINLSSITYRVYQYTEIKASHIEFAIGLLAYLGITSLIILTKNKYYLKLWNIKAFITLIFMIIYEYVYGLDSSLYYAEAIKETMEFPSYNANGTYYAIYTNRIFTYFVGNSYYSLKLLNSFLSFIGLVYIYKTYKYILTQSNIIVKNDKFIFILFLFPSILFWSSILGKDPLNLFCVSIYMYAFIHLIDSKKLIYIILIILSIFLITYIRSWWSIIMLIPIILFYMKLNNLKSIIFVIILLPIANILITGVLQSRGIDSIDQLFIIMSSVSKNLSYGGSSMEVAEYTGFGSYVLMYIPNTFTAIFRPMPWDIRNPFTLLAAIENVILFYLTYKYVFLHFKIVWNNKYLRFLLLFIFSWSLLYSIISPTNLGMAVRFKLQILPVMLIIIFVSRSIVKSKIDNIRQYK